MFSKLRTVRTHLWFISVLCLAGLVSAAALPHQWVTVAHADDDDDGDDDDSDDDDDRPARRKPVARSELVAIGLNDGALARLSERGYRVMAQSQSGLVRRPIARLLAPSGRSFAASLRDVRREDPAAVVARNDLYRRHLFTRYQTEGGGCGENCPAFAMTQWLPEAGKCSSRITIGLIDTGVDVGHPSLEGAKLTSKTVRRSDRAASDQAHGTGVASLLAGRPGSAVRGVIPDASVMAADAFHKAGSNDAADAFDLVAALDWLTDGGATVINMSLSGPPNDVLEQAIGATLAKGVSIIAAAGKAGPSATGYPARYPGVIAVTGIDGRLRALRSSNRRDHIAFAAPGAGIVVAGRSGTVSRVDGSSFAAPFVAAVFALHASAETNHATALERVRADARDLGASGRDPIYGWGLVQFQNLPRC